MLVLFVALAGVMGSAALAGPTASAAALSIHGTMTSDLSITLDAPHDLFWHNALELTIDEALGSFDVLATVRLDHDSRTDNARLDMNEASLVWYGHDWRVNVGRQVVNWGMALKLNPLNVVNPVDVTDHEMNLVPVQSVAVTHYPNPDWEVTAVWIPEFRPAVDAMPGLPALPTERPAAIFGNSEVAGRALYRGLGYDLSVIGFYGWDDFPHMRMGPNGPGLKFDRAAAVGVGYASGLGNAGLWAEGRYTTYPDDDDRERIIEALLGGDYSFANGITWLGQMRVHDDSVNPGQLQLMTTFAGDWASIHAWRFGLMVDPDAKTWSARPEVEFSLADAVTLTAYASIANGGDSAPAVFTQPDQIGMSLAATF